MTYTYKIRRRDKVIGTVTFADELYGDHVMFPVRATADGYESAIMKIAHRRVRGEAWEIYLNADDVPLRDIRLITSFKAADE